MGLVGTKVDAIDHYTESIETLSKEVSTDQIIQWIRQCHPSYPFLQL